MANYTILLIDYNPRSIDVLRAPLENAGYRVVVARDGMAGVRAFHDLKPDLTLVEAMLPKKHGFDVCHELKATDHGRKTPVLILTGVYKGRKYRSQAMHQYGCDRYLEKPLSSEDLLAAIRSFLAEPTSSAEAGEITKRTGTEHEVTMPAGLAEVDRQPIVTEPVLTDSLEPEIVDQLDNLFSDKRSSDPTANLPSTADPKVEI
jgi:DNA-binding response OmpR family regulator